MDALPGDVNISNESSVLIAAGPDAAKFAKKIINPRK